MTDLDTQSVKSENSEHSASAGDKHRTDHDSPDAKRRKPRAQKEEPGKASVRSSEEPHVPSSVLEKGVFYFFVRGRVDTGKLESVDDIARSYILLRPIDKDSKLGEGTLDDSGTPRLLALPKKVLPSSGKDRFMAFVEKSSPSYDELKTTFLAAADYETKTSGKRHTPAATPVGEGVYAITTTGRESHLAYIRTLPEKAGSFQEELGLKDRGSFILTTKSPKHKGPAWARLPEGPKFPEKILDDFGSLRWLPSRPEHLDYVNAQVLLIGEKSGLERAVEPQEKDQERGDEEPMDVLSELEEEDLGRMRHLPGSDSDSIFADLRAHAENYPKLQTTF